MQTAEYTVENLLTTNDSWAYLPNLKDNGGVRVRGGWQVNLLSLVNNRFTVKNWDDTCDEVWVVCIHREVLSEEVVTLLYEDGSVMTAELNWFLNAVVRAYDLFSLDFEDW